MTESADNEAADNSEQDPLARFDTTVPQSARIWNYWLGGKDNYEVDRVAGDAFREIFPGIETGARAARYFLARAVRHLAAEEGIRQFLDIGTGIPTANNTHEVAQVVAPQSRVVYVDSGGTLRVLPRPAQHDHLQRVHREPGRQPSVELLVGLTRGA